MLAQAYRGVCHTKDFCRGLRKHIYGDGNLSDVLKGSRIYDCWRWERLGGCFALHRLYDGEIYVDWRRITLGDVCDKEYGNYDRILRTYINILKIIYVDGETCVHDFPNSPIASRNGKP